MITRRLYLNRLITHRLCTVDVTDKSVSFEKSVSFSDEPPDMNSPKQHSPQSSGGFHIMFMYINY